MVLDADHLEDNSGMTEIFLQQNCSLTRKEANPGKQSLVSHPSQQLVAITVFEPHQQKHPTT